MGGTQFGDFWSPYLLTTSYQSWYDPPSGWSFWKNPCEKISSVLNSVPPVDSVESASWMYWLISGRLIATRVGSKKLDEMKCPRNQKKLSWETSELRSFNLCSLRNSSWSGVFRNWFGALELEVFLTFLVPFSPTSEPSLPPAAFAARCCHWWCSLQHLKILELGCRMMLVRDPPGPPAHQPSTLLPTSSPANPEIRVFPHPPTKMYPGLAKASLIILRIFMKYKKSSQLYLDYPKDLTYRIC